MLLYENDHLRSGSNLYYDRNRKNLLCGPHLHNSFEFTYVYSGCVEATVGSQTYLLQAGDGLLVFPNQIHSYRTPEASESYVCIFPASLVGEYYEKVRKSVAVCPVFRPDDPALPTLLHSAEADRYLLKSHLYRLIATFHRSARYCPRDGRGSELLGQLITAISQRYTEPITLKLLARELGYDHRYLTNLLQQQMRTTFRHLLNEYRISYAKYLLSSSPLPIEALAERCGYDSMCTFHRNFRQITGTTPNQWRQQHLPTAFRERDLESAKELLLREGYTLVLRRGEVVHTDTRRGIRPLLELWDQGATVQNFCAADKVVGKAAAYLYQLLKIGSIHAQVISQPALELLTQSGIPVTYESLVPAIRNRTNTGFCPMETAVREATDPQDALARIRAALKALGT